MENVRFNRGEVWHYTPQGAKFGHVQDGDRYVVIVSNDVGNSVSPTLLVVPCSASAKPNLPVNAIFMIGRCFNTALCSQITTVDKLELTEFKIRLPDYVMSNIDRCIKVALSFETTQ